VGRQVVAERWIIVERYWTATVWRCTLGDPKFAAPATDRELTHSPAHMLARRVLLATITACTAACHSAAPAVVPTPVRSTNDTLPLAERLAIVDKMDAHTRANFAHWQPIAAQSYDSMVAAFRTRASASASRYDFDLAAFAFAAGLQNGHTSFTDRWLRSAYPGRVHFEVLTTSEGWLVTSSAYPQLRAGELIRTIDGESFDAFYQRNRAYLPESGERLRRVRITYTAALYPQKFTLGLASGRTARIERSAAQDSIVRTRAAADPLVAHRWIVKDSLAYMSVGAWEPRAYEDSALAILSREYVNAPALIVDVRGNGGGSTPSRLIRRLTGDVPARYMPVIASRIAASEIRGPGSYGVASASDRYRGTLVILADHNCASACDDFVSPFFDNRAGTVVGDTTWGSTGQPRFLELGNEMSFRVSARRYTLYDGAPFEGAGVPPHEYVPLTSTDLLAGRDARLERAIAIARERLARR
jgi:carboxyl-terminal processing protease